MSSRVEMTFLIYILMAGLRYMIYDCQIESSCDGIKKEIGEERHEGINEK